MVAGVWIVQGLFMGGPGHALQPRKEQPSRTRERETLALWAMGDLPRPVEWKAQWRVDEFEERAKDVVS